MRLQPSVAVAYIPSSTQSITQKAGGFDYTPTWRTAVVPALGFEFAKGNQRLFTVSAFYTAPLGQKEQSVTTSVESKTITTSLQPRLATWGVTMGIPFNFAKAKKDARVMNQAPSVNHSTQKKGCTRSYYRRSVQL
jgi:hypothetical protein